jgi:hypothetical protein
MAGYSGTPLVKKLGLKENFDFAVLNSPVPYKKLLGGLPKNAKESRLKPGLHFIHFFGVNRSDLAASFPKLKKALAKNGTLWISWPKRSSKVETDLTEGDIREIGLENGLVDVKVCAVDDTWSGLKFVFRSADR